LVVAQCLDELTDPPVRRSDLQRVEEISVSGWGTLDAVEGDGADEEPRAGDAGLDRPGVAALSLLDDRDGRLPQHVTIREVVSGLAGVGQSVGPAVAPVCLVQKDRVISGGRAHPHRAMVGVL
jgi:hypothetical protein